MRQWSQRCKIGFMIHWLSSLSTVECPWNLTVRLSSLSQHLLPELGGFFTLSSPLWRTIVCFTSLHFLVWCMDAGLKAVVAVCMMNTVVLLGLINLTRCFECYQGTHNARFWSGYCWFRVWFKRFSFSWRFQSLKKSDLFILLTKGTCWSVVTWWIWVLLHDIFGNS